MQVSRCTGSAQGRLADACDTWTNRVPTMIHAYAYMYICIYIALYRISDIVLLKEMVSI